jgi:glycosyltransferase involved in cell wall biosynthesis
MQRICTSLHKSGYEVLLVGRLLKSSRPLPDYPFGTRRLKNIFNSGKLFYLEYNLRLFFFLVFSRCYIQGAVDLDTILAHVWSAAIRKRKFIYDAHEYFTEVPEVVDRPLVKKTWQRIEKYAVPRAAACYTVSSGLAELFRITHGKHFAVIKNVPFSQGGRSVSDPEKKLEEKKPVILYQGALNIGRCLEKLLPAIQGLPVQLWIAGEGDLSRQLRKQVKDSGQEDQVQFLGFVEPAKLREITSSAFIGFNVLENKGLSYFYSLANKCFDYIQAGVPVMCSPFPEYEALNRQHSAFVFVQPDTASIRQGIVDLLNEKETYRQLTNACKEAASDWIWEKEEIKLLGIYEQVG